MLFKQRKAQFVATFSVLVVVLVGLLNHPENHNQLQVKFGPMAVTPSLRNLLPDPPAGSLDRWPFTGPIASFIDSSHPLGIDIDGFEAEDTHIYAPANGKVYFSGGKRCCAYGLYIIINHPNGLQTLYGHMDELDVATGDTVSSGQVLGIVGKTGYATGPHLHFEVHQMLNNDPDQGVYLNPIEVLPKNIPVAIALHN